MYFENSDCDEKNANTSASEFQFVTMIRDFNSSKSLKILIILKRLMIVS